MAEFSANTGFNPIEQKDFKLESQEKLSDYYTKEYEKLTPEEKHLLHEMFRDADTFSENYKALQNLVFNSPPPTPQEFLNPVNGWLTKNYVDSLYQWVKDDFVELCSGNKVYTHYVNYGSTRTGKTEIALLILFYVVVFMHHVRDVAMFFNVASGTSLCIFIMSFQYDKVYQLYLRPFYRMLERSPNMVQINFQDKVTREQKKYVGTKKIVWSKAALVGEITLASGLQLVAGNDDALSILGNNICTAIVSELAYYIEKAGASEDAIFRLYTDLVERIRATVEKGRLSFVYLDSSANLAESQIESFILNKLRYRDEVLFRWRRRWEVPEIAKKHFPIWHKDKTQTFKICSGDGVHPPKIYKEGDDYSDIPTSLLIDVPIDALKTFEDNLVKSIKDVAGQPSVRDSKFINNALVIERMWDDTLENIESLIVVDSSSAPAKYIWTIVAEKFFTKYDGKNYRIKRAAQEPRWIHIDTAYSAKGDVVGFTMLHKEWSERLKDPIYVVDFTFAIGPGENGINLEALTWFVHDLAVYGAVPLVNVTVDTFQTQNMIQFWQRSHIPCEKLSVDTSIEPYMNLFSCLLQESVKAGRNVFLKNNLLSLYRKKSEKGGREKIDHTLGKTNNKYNGDFKASDCGVNAKDVSDSLAGALFASQKSKHVPVTHYERETQRISSNNNIVVDFTKKRGVEFQAKVDEVYTALHKGRF